MKLRVDGGYLASVLKACGGMVDFKLATPISPMLFASNGYQVVVMPMMTNEASEQAKKDREAKAEVTTTEQAEPKAKGKGKGRGKGRNRARASNSLIERL